MIFFGFSEHVRDFDSRACSFNGPHYTHENEMLNLSKLKSIPIVACLGENIDVTKSKLNLDSMQKTLHDQIKHLENFDNVVGYYILPEEIRPWRKNELSYFKNLMTLVNQHNSRKLPCITYIPFNRTMDNLTTLYEAGIDLIGKSAYLELAIDKPRTKIQKAINMCKEFIKSRRDVRETTKLGVYLMLAQDTLISEQDIFKIIRHDCFLSFILGAQFIGVWSFFKRTSVKKTFHSQKKAYLDAIAEINKYFVHTIEKVEKTNELYCAKLITLLGEHVTIFINSSPTKASSHNLEFEPFDVIILQ